MHSLYFWLRENSARIERWIDGASGQVGRTALNINSQFYIEFYHRMKASDMQCTCTSVRVLSTTNLRNAVRLCRIYGYVNSLLSERAKREISSYLDCGILGYYTV